MIGGHRALRLLAWLKLKGVFRRQARRMRSVSGLVFMLVGLALTAVWLASILLAPRAASGPRWEPELMRSAAQFSLLFFTLLSLASALQLKGVYFHKGEVERLLSIPVTRADLVRHRMQVDAARTLLGAVVLGFLAARRTPVPLYGFVGAFEALLTLGVARQLASLLLGDPHGRLGRFFQRHSLSGFRVLIGLAAWGAIMLLIFGDELVDDLGAGSMRELVERALLNRPAQLLLLPFRPWAEVMTASSVGPFLGWLGASVLLTLALYELTARLRVDFREQALATSEDVARRLRSLRRGGPFGGGRISDAAAGRRVPWLFGRGPFGAVAWIKEAGILRKARSTLLTSLVVIGLVTVVLSIVLGGKRGGKEEDVAVASSAMIGLLGMWYLAGGLRFDFRSDLDRMETIKSWPLAPWKLFLATLLPETLLVSTLLGAAIVLRALVLGILSPGVLLVVAVLPFATLAWLSVDNTVFLLAPVRFVPGQEGTLHHTGRALVLLFLRGLIFLGGGLAVALPGYGAFFAGRRYLGLDPMGARVLGVLVGLWFLLAVDALLVHLGGRMLRRFDVARDRA